jgi:hypothetical protein
MRATVGFLLVALLFATPQATAAQELEYDNLSDVFSGVFDYILTEAFQLSPGPHADHYIPASERTSAELIPALNTLISSSVASFPLTSTVAGITFDFSSGAPVRVVESLGPIFSETPATLGYRKITFGFNATHLGFDKLRNTPLKDVEFAFLHEDVGDPGLGTDASELDVVRVKLGLDADASIFAFHANYGVTSNFDVGIALPLLLVRLAGTTVATIESYTLPAIGLALHFFDGDRFNPVLAEEVPYSKTATGIGDVGIRLKYRLPLVSSTAVAAILDVRLPTGDEANFLGTGSTTGRLILAGSSKMGAFTPHVNVGYDYRGAEQDSDELEFAVGFDQQLSRYVTFAIDLLGEVDLNKDEAIHLLPGSQSISFTDEVSGGVSVREIELSNVSDRTQDNTFRVAIGARFAPTDRLQLLGNVLISVVDSGLYSNIAPTIGFSVLL